MPPRKWKRACSDSLAHGTRSRHPRRKHSLLAARRRTSRAHSVGLPTGQHPSCRWFPARKRRRSSQLPQRSKRPQTAGAMSMETMCHSFGKNPNPSPSAGRVDDKGRGGRHSRHRSSHGSLLDERRAVPRLLPKQRSHGLAAGHCRPSGMRAHLRAGLQPLLGRQLAGLLHLPALTHMKAHGWRSQHQANAWPVPVPRTSVEPGQK